MSITLILAMALGVFAAIGGAGYVGYGVGVDSEVAKRSRDDVIVQKVLDAANKGAAEAIAANKPINNTIVQEVQREVATRVVYRDCRHAPSGLRSINEALTGTRAERAGNSELPRPVTAVK
jgi:hypothetical protein